MNKVLLLAIFSLLISLSIFGEDTSSDYEIFRDKNVKIVYTYQDADVRGESISGTVIDILDSGLLIRTKKTEILVRYKYIIFVETN